MEAAGIGPNLASSGNSLIAVVADWDPYLPQAPLVVAASLPECTQDAVECEREETCAPRSSVPQLQRILNALADPKHQPVAIPFPLDLLTVQTRDAYTLSHCLDACKVSSDIVY